GRTAGGAPAVDAGGPLLGVAARPPLRRGRPAARHSLRTLREAAGNRGGGHRVLPARGAERRARRAGPVAAPRGPRRPPGDRRGRGRAAVAAARQPPDAALAAAAVDPRSVDRPVQPPLPRGIAAARTLALRAPGPATGAADARR